jgi:hypothetical protein
LTTAVARELVVTLKGGAEMAILRLAVAACADGVSESVAVTVKLMGPVAAPVGVPEITPVLGLIVSPVGSAPTVTAHVYGATPPAAARLWLYEVPRVPPASVEVVTLRVGAVIVMLRLLVTLLAGLSESLTFTVKLLVPTKGPVGVPVIAPEEAFRLNPAGKLPDVNTNV